ncbi:MAG: hypothetical protein IT256_08680 [Chitinophagaceae bacterium]|nr:hypothetical protein [Chitinophagaceae bacterium]
MRRSLFSFSLCIFFSWTIAAQNIKKKNYFFIDSLIQVAGPMEGASLQYIVDSISNSCKTELQITRAFYSWQTHFVSFDNKRKRRPENNVDNASSALMERSAASHGYAQMFQAMCALKSIECEVVKGYLRYRTKDIGRFDASEIHYWNIVTIKNTQYLIDVALGCGPMDEKGRINKQEFTDAWWLCNRKLFALSHFPEQPINQLLEYPITKSEFTKAPLVFAGAIIGGLVPTKALSNILKVKEGDTLRLKFHFVGGFNIASVKLSFDKGGLIDAPFDFDEFGFYLLLPAPKPGRALVSIYLNGKLSFVFKAEIRKKPSYKPKKG